VREPISVTPLSFLHFAVRERREQPGTTGAASGFRPTICSSGSHRSPKVQREPGTTRDRALEIDQLESQLAAAVLDAAGRTDATSDDPTLHCDTLDLSSLVAHFAVRHDDAFH
jgi:hypothetical protein